MKTVKIYPVQNHPQDSRVIMEDGDTIQTLNAKMGTGGGNTPFVLIVPTTSSAADTPSTNPESPPSGRPAAIRGGGEGLLVITAGETHESISAKNRGAVCEQPSGQLHGAGRIQRYAPGDRGRTR